MSRRPQPPRRTTPACHHGYTIGRWTMKRSKRTCLLASIILAGIATLSTVPASGAARARAARTISGADSAHLHLLHQDESLLFEEGKATGVLPGRMSAQLTVARSEE